MLRKKKSMYLILIQIAANSIPNVPYGNTAYAQPIIVKGSIIIGIIIFV